MSTPIPLPSAGDTDWMDWASQVDTETRKVAAKADSSVITEVAQDATAALFAAGTHIGITFTYDDAGNRLSAAVTSSGGSNANRALYFAMIGA